MRNRAAISYGKFTDMSISSAKYQCSQILCIIECRAHKMNVSPMLPFYLERPLNQVLVFYIDIWIHGQFGVQE